jgi:hypothetical protein
VFTFTTNASSPSFVCPLYVSDGPPRMGKTLSSEFVKPVAYAPVSSATIASGQMPRFPGMRRVHATPEPSGASFAM